MVRVNSRNPRPLPHVIYVRRRVAAVVILLVVVALLIWAATALGGGRGDQDSSAAAETSESTAFAATEEPTPSFSQSSTSAEATDTEKLDQAAEMSSGAESSESENETTATEPKKTTCSVEDLVITASTDRPSYGPGDKPVFSMTVKNPTAADCTVDLQQDVLRFEVYDLHSNQRVWSDVDCNAPVAGQTKTFPADSERYYQAVWSRTTSAPNRCSNRTQVPAGGYYLHTVMGNNASAPIPFNLG